MFNYKILQTVKTKFYHLEKILRDIVFRAKKNKIYKMVCWMLSKNKLIIKITIIKALICLKVNKFKKSIIY